MQFARIFLEATNVNVSLVIMVTLSNARMWMNALQRSTNAVPMHIALIQLVLTSVLVRKVSLVTVESVRTKRSAKNHR